MFHRFTALGASHISQAIADFFALVLVFLVGFLVVVVFVWFVVWFSPLFCNCLWFN